jgi:ferredoxin
VFVPDLDGFPLDPPAMVSPEHRDDVRRAAAGCPERAITIDETAAD